MQKTSHFMDEIPQIECTTNGLNLVNIHAQSYVQGVLGDPGQLVKLEAITANQVVDSELHILQRSSDVDWGEHLLHGFNNGSREHQIQRRIVAYWWLNQEAAA
ncbi:MAG: hypothetical protein AAGA35_03000 [Patescibacteria group bacterium]